MRSRERPRELLQPGLGSDADGVHGGGEERLEAAVQFGLCPRWFRPRSPEFRPQLLSWL